jgi:hypothetical protein
VPSLRSAEGDASVLMSSQHKESRMRDLTDIQRLNDEAVERASLKKALAEVSKAEASVARKQSLIAASLLITAFDWKTSEEGPEFWRDIVVKLEQKAGVPAGTAMLLTVRALADATKKSLDKAA